MQYTYTLFFLIELVLRRLAARAEQVRRRCFMSSGTSPAWITPQPITRRKKAWGFLVVE